MAERRAARRAMRVVYDWRTGRVTAVIPPPRSAPQGFTGVAAALWANASGSAALAACGVQGMVNGAHFSAENLHFPAPNLGVGNSFFAW